MILHIRGTVICRDSTLKQPAAGRLRGVPYGWVVVTDFILPHSLNGARYQDASTRVMHTIG